MKYPDAENAEPARRANATTVLACVGAFRATRAGGDQAQRRQELQVVVAEEPQADRHRAARAGEQPQPEIGVGATRTAPVDATRVGSVHTIGRLHATKRERHHREQAEHVRRRGLEPEVRAVAEHGPEQEVARSDEERDDRERDREAAARVGDAAATAASSTRGTAPG